MEKSLNKPVSIGLFGKYIDKKKIKKNLNTIFKYPKFFYLDEKQSYLKYQRKNLDLIISYGYGRIFKDIFFTNNSNCRIINFHLAYLPYGRGIFPNLFSVINKKECGFTIHLINNKKIDCEPILFRKKIHYIKIDTLRSIFNNIKSEMDQFIDKNLKKIIFTKRELLFKRKYTYYNRIKAESYFSQLPHGWETSVSQILKVKFK